MKLRGSIFSVGMVLTLAASPAGAQNFMTPPRGPAPPLPNVAMGNPAPGGSAFPSSVATMAPDGSPAPAGDAPPPAPMPHYGLPGFCLPMMGGAPEPECPPEFMPFPTMIGDLVNYFGTRFVSIRTQLQDDSADPSRREVSDFYLARIPIVSRGAFKIAECESPQPQSRIYYNFNYYTQVRSRFDYLATLRRDLDGQNAGEIIEIPGPLSQTDFKKVAVRRDTLGFECAVPDRIASFGMRISLIDVQQDVSTLVDPEAAAAANDDDPSTVILSVGPFDGLQHWEVSDITLIGKVALKLDCATGDVLSVGLAATIPTGHGFTSITEQDRKLHPALLQPFVGYLCSYGDWYLHGFCSGLIPTDSRDVYFLFNNVGVGFWCYKNECADDLFVNALVPTVEVHVTTPLRNGNIEDDPIGSDHTVVLTGGLHVFTFGWASITGGVGTVVSGPKPYDLLYTAQVNLRF